MTTRSKVVGHQCYACTWPRRHLASQFALALALADQLGTVDSRRHQAASYNGLPG